MFINSINYLLMSTYFHGLEENKRWPAFVLDVDWDEKLTFFHGVERVEQSKFEIRLIRNIT